MTFALGIAAALSAPLVMTVGFLVWEDHWRGSPFALNLYKCNLASLGFLVLVLSERSYQWTSEAVGYLFLSSVVGIVIGDWTWLRGLQLLGAKRVILMDSLKPFLAAVWGWLVLDEELRLPALAGIVLTVAGVLLVSLEARSEEEKADPEKSDEHVRPDTVPMDAASVLDSTPLSQETSDEPVVDQSVEAPEGTVGKEAPEPNSHHTTTPMEDAGNLDPTPHVEQRQQSLRDQRATAAHDIRTGYALAIVNVVLDTYGAVLIKDYAEEFTVWEIGLVRFGFAGVVLMGLSALLLVRDALQKGPTESKTDAWYALPVHGMKRRDWMFVSCGVALVTVLTPALSNYALFQVALALALTLGSVGPLYSLPLSYLLQREVPTWRATLGATLAVGGIVVLAFFGNIDQ